MISGSIRIGLSIRSIVPRGVKRDTSRRSGLSAGAPWFGPARQSLPSGELFGHRLYALLDVPNGIAQLALAEALPPADNRDADILLAGAYQTRSTGLCRWIVIMYTSRW